MVEFCLEPIPECEGLSMSLYVCPAAVIAAPCATVWKVMCSFPVDPGWMDVEVQRLDPAGPLQPGQTLLLSAKAYGRCWRSRMGIDAMDQNKGVIDIRVYLPFGIREPRAYDPGAGPGRGLSRAAWLKLHSRAGMAGLAGTASGEVGAAAAAPGLAHANQGHGREDFERGETGVVMPRVQAESGLAPINGALIYYEVAGEGDPFVMIHAGVADSRQWNNEFEHFVDRYRVLRYDMRGYGKSQPVPGEYSHLRDLTALLKYLGVEEPVVAMGCSMGGGLAMNLALARPSLVRALIMVDSGPPGLELDVPDPPQAEAAEAAWKAGDLDRVAELETQIWFDGMGRTPDRVDQAMRRLVYEMDRTALANEVQGLGKRLPDSEVPAVQRLAELKIPVLVVIGAHDTPYMQAAADYMVDRISLARKVTIADAAHLPNLDHPDEFQRVVTGFLDLLHGNEA